MLFFYFGCVGIHICVCVCVLDWFVQGKHGKVGAKGARGPRGATGVEGQKGAQGDRGTAYKRMMINAMTRWGLNKLN